RVGESSVTSSATGRGAAGAAQWRYAVAPRKTAASPSTIRVCVFLREESVRFIALVQSCAADAAREHSPKEPPKSPPGGMAQPCCFIERPLTARPGYGRSLRHRTRLGENSRLLARSRFGSAIPPDHSQTR